MASLKLRRSGDDSSGERGSREHHSAQNGSSGRHGSSGHQSSHGSASRSQSDDRSITDSRAFTVGHALFGAVLAFMALDNLRNLEERIGYAEANGAPMADVAVPTISSSLLVGGVGIALWRAPVAAASAVAAFFVSVTPVMHDFWAIDDEQEAQQQQIHFLKNSALLGATLAFLGIGKREEK